MVFLTDECMLNHRDRGHAFAMSKYHCCTCVAMQVCESDSACQFSASCTVAVDDCYEQFKSSMTNGTAGATFYTCQSGCTFQVVPQAYGGALFSPLPAMVTDAEGNSTIQDGICFNSTLWSVCGSKKTEVNNARVEHVLLLAICSTLSPHNQG
jgi:hypothetical protein